MTDFWIAGGAARANDMPGQPDIRLGEVLDATAVIRNLSQDGAPTQVAVRFYLSEDRALSSDDIPLEIQLATVAPYNGVDFSNDVYVNVTEPLSGRITPGDYFLIAQVDYYDDVAETDEGNNVSVLNNIFRGSHSELNSYFIRIGETEAELATTGELFATRGGETAFMAKLALAAYHLETATGQELEQSGSNTRKATGEAAYNSLPDGLQLLESADLPLLDLSAGIDPDDFPLDGLGNGIYTNRNAAALVARSDDAVFIAFRGTNDQRAIGSPDMLDWVTTGDHYDLFDPLISTIRNYIINNDISTLYLTGHSLGGAMVEAFVRENPDLRFGGALVETATFASPGLRGDAADRPETFSTNFRIDGDPVPWPNVFTRETTGDVNTVYHNLIEEIEGLSNSGTFFDLHSMSLYKRITDFLSNNNLFSTTQHGIDFNRIHLRFDEFDFDQQSFGIGADQDGIRGTNWRDIIMGGGGNDNLVGARGQDYIDGGEGFDTLFGGRSDDFLYGRGGNDRLWGERSQDILRGGRGNDDLFGGRRDDTLYGGSDADTLVGGRGQDQLFGGSGVDLFVFESLRDTNSGDRLFDADVIRDWDTGRGNDAIDLSGIDARTGIFAPGDQDFAWIGDNRFTGFHGELRYRIGENNTLVLGDRDGDGRADLQITIAGQHNLNGFDFVF